MSSTVYQDMLLAHASKKFKTVEQSRMWFRTSATSIAKRDLKREEIINHLKPIRNVRADTLIGSLCMFVYDPKLKEELPFYDVYPVVFPFKIMPDGFYGLNLHYLPPTLRAVLMDRLYSLANSKNMTSKTRLVKLSYDVLNASANFRGFEPCVKRYLGSHIRSNIAQVPPSEWELALFLPLQLFRKKQESSIWAQSRKVYKKG